VRDYGGVGSEERGFDGAFGGEGEGGEEEEEEGEKETTGNIGPVGFGGGDEDRGGGVGREREVIAERRFAVVWRVISS